MLLQDFAPNKTSNMMLGKLGVILPLSKQPQTQRKWRNIQSNKNIPIDHNAPNKQSKMLQLVYLHPCRFMCVASAVFNAPW